MSVTLATRSGSPAAHSSPHGPPKSCRTRWARSIPSASRAAPMNAPWLASVCGKSSALAGLAEARRVPGDGARARRRRQQRLPVGARARVAVHEHDGLARAAGPASRTTVRMPSTAARCGCPLTSHATVPPATQHPADDRRPQQALRLLEHGHDVHERGRDHRVALGDRLEAPDVGVDRPQPRGPRALDLGQREVAADRHLPRVVDRRGAAAAKNRRARRACRRPGSGAARPPRAPTTVMPWP